MIFTAEHIKGFFNELADSMEKNRDQLIELDSIVGDGDLGITMADGFEAAAAAVKDSNETDIGKMLYVASKTMSSAVPSTMGTLMALGIMNGAKALRGKEQMRLDEITVMMRSWLDGVAERGKAKRGEKTFLDGLAPAVDVMESAGASSNPLDVLSDASAAADKGAKDTVGMLAKHGRAAIRGESSRVLLDPGAVVASIIVQTLSMYAQKSFGE